MIASSRLLGFRFTVFFSFASFAALLFSPSDILIVWIAGFAQKYWQFIPMAIFTKLPFPSLSPYVWGYIFSANSLGGDIFLQNGSTLLQTIGTTMRYGLLGLWMIQMPLRRALLKLAILLLDKKTE